MRARVWGPLFELLAPAVPAILTQPRSISQLTFPSLMQKLHKSRRQKIEQLFAFSLEYGIIITKQMLRSKKEGYYETRTCNH